MPNCSSPPDTPESISLTQNKTFALFVVSVLGLFLEMLLIRWISTEVRIFAYLQNTVLVVCFLGLGMGCFTCRKQVRVWHVLLPLLGLTTLMAVPVTRGWLSRISEHLSVLGDMVIWQQGVSDGLGQTVWKLLVGLTLTFGMLLLLWELFVPLGRLLGRLMDDSPNVIRAYSVNVAGSLIGIWLFVALSVFSLPPFAWFVVLAILLLALLGAAVRRPGNLVLLGLVLTTAWLAGREPWSLQTVWSPYQKLALSEFSDPDHSWSGEYVISVNNAGYQGIIDLSTEHVAQERRIEPARRGLSQYDIPLLFHPEPQQVLIVGAGSGNDVAGALRNGAGHVTAVEIDPTIIEMGRRYHPERPYDAANVTIVNDDARSFFATTADKFDLIVFGLLDSHTTTAMTNARLDHYVYTRESLTRAQELLKPGGVVALSFEAEKPYIADRMAGCLQDVFASSPLVFRVPSDASGWGGVMFVTGDQQVIRSSLEADQRLAHFVQQWQDEHPIALSGSTASATDDWPYIYLRDRRIPTLYYLLGALMLGLFAYSKRRLQVRGLGLGRTHSQWHFFFLGAAFLLLEVQNISKASVALGNTWWVNAVIISGILSMILLANTIAAAVRKLPETPVMIGLIASCLGLYFVDISRFAFLPSGTKAVVVGLLTTLPMLFSGLIFIQSFRQVERKDLALGANLMGALIGALLQSVTFVTGIKALLLIVAGLYVAALLTRPKSPATTEIASDDAEFREVCDHVVRDDEISEEVPTQLVGV